MPQSFSEDENTSIRSQEPGFLARKFKPIATRRVRFRALVANLAFVISVFSPSLITVLIFFFTRYFDDLIIYILCMLTICVVFFWLSFRNSGFLRTFIYQDMPSPPGGYVRMFGALGYTISDASFFIIKFVAARNSASRNAS